MIILLGGEKGGTGKSTIAFHLAILRASTGRDVLVVDCDHQGSSLGWSQRREVQPRIACVQVFGKGLKAEVQDLAKRYDDIIIDSGARDTPELRSAMLIADIVVSPIYPSQLDVETLEKVEDLVVSARDWNENLRNLVVINQACANPGVSEVDDAKDCMKDFEHLTLAKTVIRNRIAFRKAANSGLAVTEMPHKDQKAINEIASLYKEVFNGKYSGKKKKRG